MDYSLPFRFASGNVAEVSPEFLIQYKTVFIPYVENQQLEEAKLFFKNNYQFILNKFDITSLLIANFKNTEEYINFIKSDHEYR